MRQKIIFLSLFLLALVLFSCSNDKEEIKTQTNEFLNAMHKPVDFKTIKKIYPNMSFYSVWRVDEHHIISISEQEEDVIVSVSTFFINSKEEKFTNDFLIKLQKVDGSWFIVNSKGITSINKTDRAYALENKFIGTVDLWDIELTMAIKDAVKSRGKNN